MSAQRPRGSPNAPAPVHAKPTLLRCAPARVQLRAFVRSLDGGYKQELNQSPLLFKESNMQPDAEEALRRKDAIIQIRCVVVSVWEGGGCSGGGGGWWQGGLQGQEGGAAAQGRHSFRRVQGGVACRKAELHCGRWTGPVPLCSAFLAPAVAP